MTIWIMDWYSDDWKTKWQSILFFERQSSEYQTGIQLCNSITWDEIHQS